MDHERKRNLELAHKERFLVPRKSGGDIRAVVVYPNRYWLGMSNLGFQTVFRLFSEEDRFQVERAFMPESDHEQELQTFESGAPLSSADIVAMSVSFETDYPNVLEIASRAGVNLQECSDAGRELGLVDESRRPLIIGGGAALTLNPEPVADFFDLIVIGEAEELIADFGRTYREAKDAKFSRRELLCALSAIEGVYVPAFHRAEYNPGGPVKCFYHLSGTPERPVRRLLNDLDRFPVRTVIQTPETEFKSMFMTETGRGCEVGCRFCVAGYMYRPTRKRTRQALAETVAAGLESSESIGFVGAAVSSHPAIAEFAGSVSQAGGRAALSSIMSQRVTSELAASLSESEYKTVALAPEAGSESLRFRLGKRVCDEQIFSAVSLLAEAGIRNFKLYFIVGLPAETPEDVEAIGPLTARLREAAFCGARRKERFLIAPRLVLSVNPFIPKAWTPFQRHEFMAGGEIKRRLAVVRKAVAKLPNVEMKSESTRESYFQAVMSRGDRRTGRLLLEMRARNFSWRALSRGGLRVDGVPPPDYWALRRFGEDEILPWEIVDLRVKRELLEREYRRAFEEDVAPLIRRVKRQWVEAPQAEG